jgi:hypothetical protein
VQTEELRAACSHSASSTSAPKHNLCCTMRTLKGGRQEDVALAASRSRPLAKELWTRRSFERRRLRDL